MKIINRLVIVLVIGQSISCTPKKALNEIKDNLIVGTWNSNIETNKSFANALPIKDDTLKYEKNIYLRGFRADNSMWMYKKGEADSSIGTYSISGTQLFTSYKKSGNQLKDTLNFSASNSDLKLFKIREIDSITKRFRFEYEMNLTRIN
jgi:hypothetical protein